MLELLRILLPTLSGLCRKRHDLLLENLLLRHQLQVALRSRPRTRLKTSDRLLWLAARSIYPGWRRHLILVRPEPFSAGTAKAGGSTGAGAHACSWAGHD